MEIILATTWPDVFLLFGMFAGFALIIWAFGNS